MQFEIDCDVKAVAEFMQANCPASKLVGIAEAIQKLAPLFWGDHATESVQPLRLEMPPIRLDDPQP